MKFRELFSVVYINGIFIFSFRIYNLVSTMLKLTFFLKVGLTIISPHLSSYFDMNLCFEILHGRPDPKICFDILRTI